MNANNQIPADGLKGLLQNWRSDLVAGFMVFLIALPLSLGIAKASGFPPIAGIYTAIIGGILASLLSGSHLTIKGPAAGLIVIALGAVEELGQGDHLRGYQLALACIVVAGVIQVLFGLFKAGDLTDFFPSSVVHGMMAAIGIIIASKQIHIALGVTPLAKEPLELIEEIPHSFANMNPDIALIGIVSILIIFTLPKVKNKFLKSLPGPLLVLLAAIPMGIYFDLKDPHTYLFANSKYIIDPKQLLVSLPSDIFAGITFPNFDSIFSLVSIKYIVMFSLVGSVESLLSNKAVDTLDPYKRKANMNKDLVAVGVANTVAGAIGGLPMIAEIVRSSANINNGAKTRWANFFHGLFLLISVMLLASVIQMIPNAALAGMLIFTGYRLASPDEFIKTYKIGSEQLIIFLSTIVLTITTDLLIGVLFGMIVKFMIHLANGAGFRDMFRLQVQMREDNEESMHLELEGSAVFSNYLQFKQLISDIPKNSIVKVDFSKVQLADHTFMENFAHLEEDFLAQQGKLEAIGFENHHYFSDYPSACRKKMRNPLVSNRPLELNQRQLTLSWLASQTSLDFFPKMNFSMVRFNFLPFPFAGKIKDAENILLGARKHYNVFIADINVEEGAMMTKNEFKSTVFVLSNFPKSFPNFSLEKEGFVDFIQGFKGRKDIDFTNYPVFSSSYFLTGENEESIRRFFGEQMIRLFESEKGLNINCINNTMLLHKNFSLLGAQEIQMLLKFIDAVIDCSLENE